MKNKHAVIRPLVWTLVTLGGLFLVGSFLIFSTPWGFRSFVSPFDQIINQQGLVQKQAPLNEEFFTIETYTKEEFSRVYLDQEFESLAQLQDNLTDTFPPDWTKQGTLLYHHDYATGKTKNGWQQKRHIGINMFTNFVYVTTRWILISEDTQL